MKGAKPGYSDSVPLSPIFPDGVPKLISEIVRDDWKISANRPQWVSSNAYKEEVAMPFLEDTIRCLWFWSQSPGTGKTTEACNLMWLRVKMKGLSGAKSLRISVPDFDLMSRQEQQAIAHEVRKTAVVVLDDLSWASTATQRDCNVLYSLINTIYENGCRVIVTSSEDSKSFAARNQACAHLVDRLSEGGFKEVHTGKTSMRGLS